MASDSDSLRSPLAKRKKLALERSGTSKLKEGITAEDIVEEEEAKTRSTTPTSAAGNDANDANDAHDEDDDDMDDEDDTTEDGDEDEDDFLARELGEDWG